MNGSTCPKCGGETTSRFLIIHSENGKEICEEYFCEECAKVIGRQMIVLS